MQPNETSTTSTFASFLELFVPVFHRYLSKDSTKEILFQKSMSLQTEFIIPATQITPGAIKIEEFLFLADVRMKQEIAYRNELAQLKDKIWEKFNNLCEGSSDEDYVGFVRDRCRDVLDVLIDSSKIDKKMIAEKLFNDLMNGFESEALEINHFIKTAHVIMWKSLLTPLPIKIVDKITNIINELGNEKSSNNIAEISLRLIKDIREHMTAIEISDVEYDTEEKLRSFLEGLIKNRQICNFTVEKDLKNQNLLDEFQYKCIDKIKIMVKKEIFLTRHITLHYNELVLNEKISHSEVSQFFCRIKKSTRVLHVKFENGTIIDYRKLGNYLFSLKYLKYLNLDLSGNKIEEEGAEDISYGLKNMKNLSTLNLNLENNNIGPQGSYEISRGLTNLNNLVHLNLNLGRNNAMSDGVQGLSDGLKKLKSVSFLVLNLHCNKIKDDAAIQLAAALQQMKNISSLDLNLDENIIDVEGAKALSAALGDLENISSLTLVLRRNPMENKGTVQISNAVKKLTLITKLSLDLPNPRSDGIQSIAAALKELKNISELSLNFNQFTIGKDGATEISAALGGLIKLSALNLNLRWSQVGFEGVGAILASLRGLKNILALNLDVRGNNAREEEKKAYKQFKDENPKFNIAI